MERGLIILWHGAIVDIPSGFILCDGNGGSPDLRNRFVVGAGDEYDPGDTGGVKNQNAVGSTDGHVHVIGAGDSIGFGNVVNNVTDSASDTFTTDPFDNRPPYYALAYIMKT